MILKKFAMTRKGYLEAKKYLDGIDKDMINRELSTDGFTAVTLANSVFEKNNKVSECPIYKENP